MDVKQILFKARIELAKIDTISGPVQTLSESNHVLNIFVT